VLDRGSKIPSRLLSLSLAGGSEIVERERKKIGESGDNFLVTCITLKRDSFAIDHSKTV
jgi:hypothetical protein